MTIYAVGGDWEHNMRDDSDWHQCGYDTETKKIKRYEIGSTRYPGGVKNLPEPPAEMIPEIKHCLYVMWCNRIAYSHYAAVEHPTKDSVVGRVVELKDKCYNKARVTEPCRKCKDANGVSTGKWVNPKRPSDVRPCFSCDGSGTCTGPATKGAMVERPAGLRGKAVRADERRSMYGTWSYGTTVKVVLDSGERINAPLQKLRLVVPDPKPEDVHKIAQRQADSLNAYGLMATSAYSAMGCLCLS